MARTDRRQTRAQRELPRLIAWAVSIVAVLMLANSAWTYINISHLVTTSQVRANTELAKGTAISVSDVLPRRDFGELESSLRQALANDSLRMAVVADQAGKVLAHMKKNAAGEIVLNFDMKRLEIPDTLQKEPYLEQKDNEPTKVWYAINPGIPMGWLYLEISDVVSETILYTLRRDALIFAFIIFLVAAGFFTIILVRGYKKIMIRESELEKTNEDLSDAAHHDPLTLLPNRRLYAPLMVEAIDRSKQDGSLIAVCFLDLDGFKQVNDSLGHEFGDLLLIGVAGRLQKMVRDHDSVIRLGGDEFVLILTGMKNKSELERLLYRTVKEINQPFELGGTQKIVGVSIGVAVFPNDNVDASSLLSHADQAMYHAKNEGKNRWKFFKPQRT